MEALSGEGWDSPVDPLTLRECEVALEDIGICRLTEKELLDEGVQLGLLVRWKRAMSVSTNLRITHIIGDT